MATKNSRTLIASAVSLALSSMMLAGNLHAGKISDMYLTGVGAFDLSNVTSQLVDLDGNVLSDFTINTDGTYLPAMAPDTSFVSLVYSDSAKTEIRARLTGKDYPIGEPTGIKAINDDKGDMRADSPKNCLLSTSYLNGEGLNLDEALRKPTLCSSDFQSHKRFKVSMLDTTVVADGEAGKPIDLVFKVADEASALVRPYQVYSKINNYTGKRLSGYKVQVGRYIAGEFKTASQLGLEQQLFISLGLGEGTSGEGVPNGSNIFDPEDMATFSFGLFGDASTSKNFDQDGFFDNQRAGFYVQQTCSVLPCTTGTDPTTGAAEITYSDTVQTTGAMDSNYVTLFGDWLHQGVMPKGLFWDDDDNRATDDVLMAWWNGTNWLKPAAVRPTGTEFDVVSATEFNNWANAAASATTGEKPYYAKSIEDVLNLGPNYIVKLGNGIDGDFVIRIIPVLASAESQAQPTPWMNNLPAEGDLVPVPVTPPSSDDDGGCTIGSNNRFDPIFPALVAMGLGYFGWRRFKASK